MRLGHVDVERSPRVSVLLRVPLLQKFFIHLDGYFPILSPDSRISPFEERLLVVEIEAALCCSIQSSSPSILVRIFRVAGLERLHRLFPLPQFEFAVSLVIPEPAKPWSKQGFSPAIILGNCLGQNRVSFRPLFRLHCGQRICPSRFHSSLRKRFFRET